MADVDTSADAVERLAQTFEAEAQHFNQQVNIDEAFLIAATLRALAAERDALLAERVGWMQASAHSICCEEDQRARADRAEAEAARMRAVADAAYWHLAHEWQSHLFHAPRHAFDFAAFAPEARLMMDGPGQRLFDALAGREGA